MDLWKESLGRFFNFFRQKFSTSPSVKNIKHGNFHSKRLDRVVHFDVYLPPWYHKQRQQKYPILLFNDGQDMEAVRLMPTLNRLFRKRKIRDIIVVGIHAGDRMQEYGTADYPDYKKRGSKAKAYTNFILEELLPFLEDRYRLALNDPFNTVAGFSLGGLSALDIAWNNPEQFQKVGVFSGSLWWRSKECKPEDPDADRIAHHMVALGPKKQGLKFWFQTGTKDEEEDRNNNGIIDAIDDTLDLIKELEAHGYKKDGLEIKYLEVIDGIHHPSTWARVLPDFLVWSYGLND